jgi:hypothetical protein
VVVVVVLALPPRKAIDHDHENGKKRGNENGKKRGSS